MKRKIAILLTAMMVAVTAAGCNNNANQAGSADSSEEAASESGEETADTEGTEETTEEEREVVMHIEDDAYVSGIDVDEYVTLGEYEGLSLTKEKIVISDAEVDSEISYYETMLPYEPIDKKTVEEGDIINVDYEGKLKESGEVFEGGTAEASDIETANGGFIDGFLEGMYGHDVGETFDVECTFPEDYGNEELNGQDVVFTVTINSIQERPALSDDNVATLAETIGIEEEITTVEDLREHIREELEAAEENSQETELENQAIELVLDNFKFKEPPEHMIARYETLLNNSLEQQVMMYAMYYGQEMTADDLLTQTREAEGFEGTNEEYLRSLAIDQCNSLMALCAIAKDQDIVIPEEQIDSAVTQTLTNNGHETEEDYTKANGTRLRDMISESLTAQAAMEFLVKNADITEVEPAADDTGEETAEEDAEASAEEGEETEEGEDGTTDED